MAKLINKFNYVLTLVFNNTELNKNEQEFIAMTRELWLLSFEKLDTEFV